MQPHQEHKQTICSPQILLATNPSVTACAINSMSGIATRLVKP